MLGLYFTLHLPLLFCSHSCCIYNIYLLVFPSHFEGNLTLERISEIDFYALLLRLPLPSPLIDISLCTPAPIIHSQTLQLNLCSSSSHYGRNCYNSITRFLAGSRPRQTTSSPSVPFAYALPCNALFCFMVLSSAESIAECVKINSEFMRFGL